MEDKCVRRRDNETGEQERNYVRHICTDMASDRIYSSYGCFLSQKFSIRINCKEDTGRFCSCDPLSVWQGWVKIKMPYWCQLLSRGVPNDSSMWYQHSRSCSNVEFFSEVGLSVLGQPLLGVQEARTHCLHDIWMRRADGAIAGIGSPRFLLLAYRYFPFGTDCQLSIVEIYILAWSMLCCMALWSHYCCRKNQDDHKTQPIS